MLLNQAANYINGEFAGLTLHEARTAIIERMRQRAPALRRARGARAAGSPTRGLEGVGTEETLHVQGTSYVVDGLVGDIADRDRTLEALRGLFRMIEEKHRLVELLTHVHRIERPDGRDRVGASLRGLPPVQRRRLDVPRRPAGRHGWRDRAHPHALSTRHLRGRRCLASRESRLGRSTIACRVNNLLPRSPRRTIRRRQRSPRRFGEERERPARSAAAGPRPNSTTIASEPIASAAICRMPSLRI